jgi:hypothetical protein
MHRPNVFKQILLQCSRDAFQDALVEGGRDGTAPIRRPLGTLPE